MADSIDDKLQARLARYGQVILDHFHSPDDRHSTWWINTIESADAVVALADAETATLRSDLAAARARAETAEAKVARVEAQHVASSNDHGPDHCEICSNAAQAWVKWPCPTAAALSEPAAESDTSDREARCPTCRKTRDDLTPGPYDDASWGRCPESFHFRPVARLINAEEVDHG